MTREKIMKSIGVMSSDGIIALWNECIKEKGYSDDKVFYNGREFFDEMFGNAYDAVLSVIYGDWRDSDEFVAFDEYGNVRSFNGWEGYGSPIDADILANWLLENHEKAKEIGIVDEDDGEEI